MPVVTATLLIMFRLTIMQQSKPLDVLQNTYPLVLSGPQRVIYKARWRGHIFFLELDLLPGLLPQARPRPPLYIRPLSPLAIRSVTRTPWTR